MEECGCEHCGKEEKDKRGLKAVILVGGGAILLKHSLPYFFKGKAILPDDPIQSIARGLWKLSFFQNNHRNTPEGVKKG